MPEKGTKKLKDEAEILRDALRRQKNAGKRRAFPIWKKIVYLVLILGSLSGSTFLLISQESRTRLVQRVAAGVFDLYPSESRVYELPAPPPRPTEAVVRTQGPTSFSSEEYEGVLYADLDATGDGSNTEGDSDEDEFVAPPKSPGSQEAYALLVEQSELVAQLVSGQLDEFEFLEWTPLQNDPPRFLIDLSASRDGNELHLVWQVNVESGSVQAMSQAARDLVAGQ